ncbi:hypothetical protein ACW2QC_09325 [Virgibacillus sp. FSP13]
MQKDWKLSEFMGVLFIVIGIIGFVVIIASFDYDAYKEVTDYPSLYEDYEVQTIKDEHFNNWVIGIGTLIVNLAIGTVLITLGKIHSLLEVIASNKRGLTNEHKETLQQGRMQ